MKDPLHLIQTLHRRPLLVRTAKIALADYRRDQRLPRLFKTKDLPGPSQAAMRLIGMEADLEAARTTRDASYSPARHVEVLTALMSEAHDLRARVPQSQAKASVTSVLRLAM